MTANKSIEALYLQRWSDVLVICMVSPVTRCSTTVASNVTTYRHRGDMKVV